MQQESFLDWESLFLNFNNSNIFPRIRFTILFHAIKKIYLFFSQMTKERLRNHVNDENKTLHTEMTKRMTVLSSGGPSFGATGALPQLFFRSEKGFKKIAQKTVCKRLKIHPTQFHYWEGQLTVYISTVSRRYWISPALTHLCFFSLPCFHCLLRIRG